MKGDLLMGVRRSVSDESRLLDASQVAEMLGLSGPRALYRRRARRTTPPALLVGASLRWRLSEIERWLDERHDATEDEGAYAPAGPGEASPVSRLGRGRR
jgi:predicted DNA-binding transcriptional regulator AlpA